MVETEQYFTFSDCNLLQEFYQCKKRNSMRMSDWTAEIWQWRRTFNGCINQTQRQKFLLILCHNIHTKTKVLYLDSTFEYFTPLGVFLRHAFGDRYYSIGCAYDNGVYWENWEKNEPRIIRNTPPAKKGEIDYALKFKSLQMNLTDLYFMKRFQSRQKINRIH